MAALPLTLIASRKATGRGFPTRCLVLFLALVGGGADV